MMNEEGQWYLEGTGMIAVDAVWGDTRTDQYGNRYTEPVQTIYKYRQVTIRPATPDDVLYRSADGFSIHLPNREKAEDLRRWYLL
jgi:hypothetical protein